MGLLDFLQAKKYKSEIERLKSKLNDLGSDDFFRVQDNISAINSYVEKQEEKKEILIKEVKELELEVEKIKLENEKLQNLSFTLQKNIETQKRKLQRTKELYKSVDYSIKHFHSSEDENSSQLLSPQDSSELDDLAPSVILKLHSMDIKDLKKAFKENSAQIDKVLNTYTGRYTTKANQTIYQLMVIALRAELQNILYDLKFQKLDVALDLVKNMVEKYLKIASAGNQSIVTTLTRFIGEIEYLFINAVKIEYNYYVKKEQARQEQLAIRQQMRQEAEERQRLQEEQKHIEIEETKFENEIDKINTILSETTDNKKITELQAKILELQSQLSDILIKKDEITKLQNGKAGHIYIISNLGSFGETIFKIGMTRRLNPQERIDELSNASVPFKFDVHSFIFSEDAVELENKLHSLLNDKRVNKVNLRKEFFNVTIDELETLVTNIDPTAEFNKTMAAQDFRQSLSSNENYTTSMQFYYLEEDD